MSNQNVAERMVTPPDPIRGLLLAYQKACKGSVVMLDVRVGPSVDSEQYVVTVNVATKRGWSSVNYAVGPSPQAAAQAILDEIKGAFRASCEVAIFRDLLLGRARFVRFFLATNEPNVVFCVTPRSPMLRDAREGIRVRREATTLNEQAARIAATSGIGPDGLFDFQRALVREALVHSSIVG